MSSPSTPRKQFVGNLTAFGLALAATIASSRGVSQSAKASKSADQPARHAPADASLWIQIDGIRRIGTRLREHPLRFAWMTAAESGAPLTRTLDEIASSMRTLATTQGLSETLFEALWSARIEASVRKTPAGETSLTVTFDIGEHESLLQDFVDSLRPTRASDRAPHEAEATQATLAHPFGGSGLAHVGLARTKLVVSSHAAELKATLERINGTQDDAPSLATDAQFRESGVSDGTPFVRFYARSSETWAFDALAAAGITPSYLDARLRANTQSLALQVFDEGGFFRSRLRVLWKDGKALALPSNGKPDARLARMIPENSPAWVASTYDPKALLRDLQSDGVDIPGLGRLKLLSADVRAALPERDLASLATALSTSFLHLGHNPKNPELQGYVALVEDARAVREILGVFADKRDKPGSPERSIHRYEAKRGGDRLFLTLIDDMLLAARSEASESALLERALSGKAAATIAQRLAANSGRDALLGVDSAASRIAVFDGDDRARLRAIASHFESDSLRASANQNSLTIEGRSATGMAHAVAMGLSVSLPRGLENIYAAREQWVLQHAEEWIEAQRKYVTAAKLDRDRDGKGEPEALPILRRDGMLTSKVFTESRGEIVEAKGYRMALLHPTDLNEQEEQWAVLAWPARPGVTGDRCWCVRSDGSIWRSRGLRGLDGASGPTTKQVFGGLSWTAKLPPEWRMQRPAADSIANASPDANADDNAPADGAGSEAGTSPRGAATSSAPRGDEARRLEIAGSSGDAKELLRFAKHADAKFRARAAWYLGKAKTENAIPSLARLLGEDKNTDVRRAAAQALTAMRSATARVSLKRGLTDADGRVRLLAATGLLGAKDPATIRALKDMVLTHEGDEHGDRSQAILAIQDSGRSEHLATLATLDSKTKQTSEALLYAFQRLSPKLPPKQECAILIQALESPVPAVAEYAVRRIAEARYGAAAAALEAKAQTAPESLRELLMAAMAAVNTQSQGTSAWLTKAKSIGKTLLARIKAQPRPVQMAIAATPLVLLVLLLLYRRSRRRGMRRGLSVDQVVGKTHQGAAPSLKSTTPMASTGGRERQR